jgi:hypothetical protein
LVNLVSVMFRLPFERFYGFHELPNGQLHPHDYF